MPLSPREDAQLRLLVAAWVALQQDIVPAGVETAALGGGFKVEQLKNSGRISLVLAGPELQLADARAVGRLIVSLTDTHLLFYKTRAKNTIFVSIEFTSKGICVAGEVETRVQMAQLTYQPSIPRLKDTNTQYLQTFGINLLGRVRLPKTPNLGQPGAPGCGPEAWALSNQLTLAQLTTLRSWGFSGAEKIAAWQNEHRANNHPLLGSFSDVHTIESNHDDRVPYAFAWMCQLMMADANAVYDLAVGHKGKLLDVLIEAGLQGCFLASHARVLPRFHPSAERLLTQARSELSKRTIEMPSAIDMLRLFRQVWGLPSSVELTPLTTLLYRARVNGADHIPNGFLALCYAAASNKTRAYELGRAVLSITSRCAVSLCHSANCAAAVRAVLDMVPQRMHIVGQKMPPPCRTDCLAGLDTGAMFHHLDPDDQVVELESDTANPVAYFARSGCFAPVGPNPDRAAWERAYLGLEYARSYTPSKLLELHGFAVQGAEGFYAPESFVDETSVAYLRKAESSTYIRPLVELLGPIGVPWLTGVLDTGVILVLPEEVHGFRTLKRSAPVYVPVREENDRGPWLLTQAGIDWVWLKLTDGKQRFLHQMVVRLALYGSELSPDRLFIDDFLNPWMRWGACLEISVSNPLATPTLFLLHQPIQIGDKGATRFTTVHGFLEKITKPWTPQKERDDAVAWLAAHASSADQAELSALLCTALEFFRVNERPMVAEPAGGEENVPKGCHFVCAYTDAGVREGSPSSDDSGYFEVLLSYLTMAYEAVMYSMRERRSIWFYVYPGQGSVACYSRAGTNDANVLIPLGRLGAAEVSRSGTVSVLSCAHPLAAAMYAAVIIIQQRTANADDTLSLAHFKARLNENINVSLVGLTRQQWTERLRERARQLDASVDIVAAEPEPEPPGHAVREGPGSGKRRRLVAGGWTAWSSGSGGATLSTPASHSNTDDAIDNRYRFRP